MGLIHPNPTPSFWSGTSVLLTGHTGFKGAWLRRWLQRLGAHVTGAALAPPVGASLFAELGGEGDPGHHVCDLRDPEPIRAIAQEARPEVVFHLAAQPLVRASYRDPVSTFSTNVMGTVHLLEALRPLDTVTAVVVVTTDKVYENREWVWGYREDDRLGGHDPYSASKAAAEIVTASYRDAFFAERSIPVATARAGNVIGGGDWAEDRLIPDAVRAWTAGETLQIRSPDAVRPWQHVLEPLCGYLLLAEALAKGAAPPSAYNVGPYAHEAASVRDVIEQARRTFGRGTVAFGSEPAGLHETSRLLLDTGRVADTLGIRPRWSLPESVERTLCWYREAREGGDARALCNADFQAFEDLGEVRP